MVWWVLLEIKFQNVTNMRGFKLGEHVYAGYLPSDAPTCIAYATGTLK